MEEVYLCIWGLALIAEFRFPYLKEYRDILRILYSRSPVLCPYFPTSESVMFMNNNSHLHRTEKISITQAKDDFECKYSLLILRSQILYSTDKKHSADILLKKKTDLKLCNNSKSSWEMNSTTVLEMFRKHNANMMVNVHKSTSRRFYSLLTDSCVVYSYFEQNEHFL